VILPGPAGKQGKIGLSKQAELDEISSNHERIVDGSETACVLTIPTTHPDNVVARSNDSVGSTGGT